MIARRRRGGFNSRAVLCPRSLLENPRFLFAWYVTDNHVQTACILDFLLLDRRQRLARSPTSTVNSQPLACANRASFSFPPPRAIKTCFYC